MGRTFQFGYLGVLLFSLVATGCLQNNASQTSGATTSTKSDSTETSDSTTNSTGGGSASLNLFGTNSQQAKNDSSTGLVTSMGAGNAASCASVNGAIQCWGENFNGQLGTGAENNAYEPKNVFGLSSDTSAVALGDAHSCAISNGSLFCWGSGARGSLGNGRTEDARVPGLVPGLKSVSQFALGAGHTCAIESGALKCWGRNDHGQLGDGTFADRLEPVAVQGLDADVEQVSAGGNSTCAIVRGGVKCWGANGFFQLAQAERRDYPVPVSVFPEKSNASRIAVSPFGHACAIVKGALDCWGSNGYGQIGAQSADLEFQSPQRVFGLDRAVKEVALGAHHSCAVHKGGVKCWGDNTFGQLGNSAFSDTTSNVPIDVTAVQGSAQNLVAGASHTCAIHGSKVECWGKNESGQLGLGSPTPKEPPKPPKGLSAGVTKLAKLGGDGSIQNPGGTFGGNGNASDFRVYGIAQGKPFLLAGQTLNLPRATENIDDIALRCFVSKSALYCARSDSTTEEPQVMSGFEDGVSSVEVMGGKIWVVKDGALYSIHLTWWLVPNPVTKLIDSGVTAIHVHINGLACAIANGALVCMGNGIVGNMNAGGTAHPNHYRFPFYGYSANPAPFLPPAGEVLRYLGSNNTMPVFVVPGFEAGVQKMGRFGKNGAFCAVKNGALYCWDHVVFGPNADTNNATLYFSKPFLQAGFERGVTDFGAVEGMDGTDKVLFSCAIQNGAVKCLGKANEPNRFGVAGVQGGFVQSETPIAIQGLESGCEKLAVAGKYACVVQNGQVRCWGGPPQPGAIGDPEQWKKGVPLYMQLQ